MKIAYKEFGNGKPVVLLHAFPLSGRMWKPQIESLTANKYRVIIPDLRGFGESGNFADINAMKDMADDVAELLRNLKIERAIFAGLSMGGYVLLSLYSRFPGKFAAIVLCDTNSSADSEEQRESRFDFVEKIEKNGIQTLIDEMLPNLICEFTKQNNSGLVTEIEQMFAETHPRAAIAALRGMAARDDFSEMLKETSLPTLLIFGAEDKVTDEETAGELNRRIPDSQLFNIENAGHYSNLEQPDAFNKIFIDFAEKIVL